MLQAAERLHLKDLFRQAAVESGSSGCTHSADRGGARASTEQWRVGVGGACAARLPRALLLLLLTIVLLLLLPARKTLGALGKHTCAVINLH